jgi:ADP-ribose pyrophosphatase
MNRTKKVELVADGPFVKLYDLIYEDKNGKERFWRFASRRKETLAENGKEKADAVVIVPFYVLKDLDSNSAYDVKFLVIKEYRPPLGDYEYGVPAGLIDEGETVVEAAKRELKEETGLEVTRVIFVTPPLYSSAGLTDESTAVVFVECEGKPDTNKNEDSEDIEIMLVSVEDMYDFINGKKDIFSGGKVGAKAFISWMYMCCP